MNSLPLRPDLRGNPVASTKVVLAHCMQWFHFQ